MTKTRPYHELLIESLADTERCRQYLIAVLDDYPEGFLKALRNVVEAQEGRHPDEWVAANVASLRQQLFSDLGPSVAAVSTILTLLGLKLTIAATGTSAPPMRSQEVEFQHAS